MTNDQRSVMHIKLCREIYWSFVQISNFADVHLQFLTRYTLYLKIDFKMSNVDEYVKPKGNWNNTCLTN